jgi:hypothetical protein
VFPRWILALFAVEAAGIAACVVVGLHLLGDGVAAAGTAVTWAKPRLHLAGPLPSLSLPLPEPSPTPFATPADPIAVIQTGNGLLDTINGSTKAVTLGQIRILGEIQHALEGYIDRELAAATRGG